MTSLMLQYSARVPVVQRTSCTCAEHAASKHMLDQTGNVTLLSTLKQNSEPQFKGCSFCLISNILSACLLSVHAKQTALWYTV